ncbi:hypothetical protein [Catenuloplanes atrovinosus]|uniref:Uncharacterized protein n=1 Tax=Catenuloplanes atrovinosus TaxID=137266 RepID=A0AAE3YL59_9ACTN|nr:hypothetical protein [Catenuloplanes atrovinosus]MDR7274532.1 hypothetical protein [Catenuloplanes atrovinosus]
MASYRELIRGLAGIDAEVDTHRAEAHEWYARTVANAETKYREAEQRATDAEAGMRAAEHHFQDIDMRVYDAWEEARARLGRVGHHPTPLTPPDGDPRGAEEWLLDAHAQLARSGRRPGLPEQTRNVLVALGVLGGVLAGLAGFGVRAAGRSLGGDLAVVLPVLALLLTLALGPIIALLAAKVYADRRGAVLEPGSVTVLVVSALVAAGLAIVVQNVG